ncbi:MerR family transcriptional regulator [Paenibacillus campi]|uniref:MerR family transcriptional regulator n=1 Tax=Paenibacillus campi TaxID=3106031 RepID=UPI002AFEE9ED|nr:MerR family transcriptional regulator [Paenibacillus sp. SGZ-1014]
MHQSEFISISAFSKMAQISRQTLIYYDRMGLLKPVFVHDNGYRYYHPGQLDAVAVITILKAQGMSLHDIRAHLHQRTPASTLELLRKQEQMIQQQIAKLERTRQMIRMQADNIELSMQVDINDMKVIWQPDIPLLISKRIRLPKVDFPESLWEDFQVRLQNEHAPIGYPGGIIVEREDMLNRDGDRMSYMFSRMETQVEQQHYMPAGYYLVSYTRADYGDTDKIYPRIFDHIEQRRYTIIGHAYEEYVQDEVSLQNPDEYLVRIMVQIAQPSV